MQLPKAGRGTRGSTCDILCASQRRCRTDIWLLALVLILSASISGLSPFAVRAASIVTAPVVQTDGLLAVVGGSGASLLTAPGGEVVRELPAGANLTAFGRSADALWTAVRTRDETDGWVATTDILMFGAGQLPVLAAGEVLAENGMDGGTPASLPTPTPTMSPMETPTPSVTPTPDPPATATPTEASVDTPTDASGLGSVAQAASGVAPSSGMASQVAVVRSGGSMLMNLPSGESLRELSTGTALTVSGRTEDGAWLAALTPQGERGWVSTAGVVVFNVERLPIVRAEVAGAGSENTGIGSENTSGQPAGESTSPAPGAELEETTPGRDISIAATVALTDARLNVRSGPSTQYPIVAKALPGQQFGATGRNSDASWIQIEGSGLESDWGWVSSEYVALTGSSQALPIVEPVSAPAFASDEAGVERPVPAPAPAQRAPTGLQGNLVVQTQMGGDIYVVDLATGATRYLTTGFDPAISPDGSTVAFTRDGGDHGLYLVDIDGSNERRIFAGGEGLRSPEFGPDGQYVVFSRLSGEYECRDVGFGICLPDNPFLSGFDMVKRPDYGLSRVNVNGSEFRDLPALTSAKAPSWSEGGIAYQSNTGLEITRDEPDATTRLLLNAPYYQDPDWQPGGNRIVFQSREGSHWEIFSVNEDGSGLFALTRPVTTLVDELPSNVSPAWNPEGTQIVYLSNRDERNDAGVWRLWVMNADGTEQRPLDVDLDIDYSYAAEQKVDWGVEPTG